MTELSQAERTILMKCLAKRLGEVTHREVQVGERVMSVARDYGRERERELRKAWKENIGTLRGEYRRISEKAEKRERRLEEVLKNVLVAVDPFVKEALKDSVIEANKRSAKEAGNRLVEWRQQLRASITAARTALDLLKASPQPARNHLVAIRTHDGIQVTFGDTKRPAASQPEALEKAKDAFGEPEGRCPECGKHLPWHKSSCSQFQPEVLSERSDTEPGETEEQSTVDADLTMPTDLRNAIRIMRQLMCSKGGEEFIARHVIHPFGLLLQPDRVPSDGRPTDVDDYGDPEAGWAGMPPDHGPGEPSDDDVKKIERIALAAAGALRDLREQQRKQRSVELYGHPGAHIPILPPVTDKVIVGIAVAAALGEVGEGNRPGEPSEKGALREALVLMAMAHEGSLIDEAFFEERYGYMDRGLLEAVRMAPTEDYEAHLTKAGREFVRAALVGESNG